MERRGGMKPKICIFRHENGNCTAIGGFCTAVNEDICLAIALAYTKGYAEGKFDEWKKHRQEKP